MGDFLHKNALTPLSQDFTALGSSCRISTNNPTILEAARERFLPLNGAGPSPKFSMRFWVDACTHTKPPWPRPYLRGWSDLVYASFAPGNFVVIDLRSFRIVGRFSPEIAEDKEHLNRVIFPMLLSVISASLGIAELHCACVAKDGRGLLLAGPTRSGKSTLSFALSQLDFSILSDDRTFCSSERGELKAWSPLTEIKLRSEALDWFPHFKNGLVKGHDLRISPKDLASFNAQFYCEPRCLLFLEPKPSTGLRIKRISQGDAANRLNRELMAESARATRHQSAIISRLTRIPSGILEYSEDPWTVAKKLACCFDAIQASSGSSEFLGQQRTNTSRSNSLEPGANARRISSRRQDPLQRFIRAPHTVTVSAMGRKIRLETNDLNILRHVKKLFSIYPPSQSRAASFHWRIIAQPDGSLDGYRRFAFSDPGLRFAQFGQRCFYAVDIDSRTAVAFVTEEMARTTTCLTIPFLDSLFCICAASLGFVPLFSNCVAARKKGILIMGAPGSGKTSASYITTKATDLHLHADDGVFLDCREGELRAGGGFWPIIFRGDALQFFPELSGRVERFSYHEFARCHLDKKQLHDRRSSPITPVACVFLERLPNSCLQVTNIGSDNLYRYLNQNLLFDEEERFQPLQVRVLKNLAKLPGYRISYGPDPAIAASAITELLLHHAHQKR